jgi:splicing factor 3A subunit 1
MPNLSAKDLDVIRLTAQFTAARGRSWMTSLSQKESRNPEFDFLRPQHSLHQFFRAMTDQYTMLIQELTIDGGKAAKKRQVNAQADASDPRRMLGRAKKRAEWSKFQESQKAKKEEQERQEALEFAQIDWHDFVVVETVEFNEADDHAELPPPTTLGDLQSASLEQKAAMSLQPHNMRIEEALPTDEDPYAVYNQQQQSYNMQMPSNTSYTQNSYATPPQTMDHSMNALQQPYQPQFDENEARAIAERTAQREQAQAAQTAATGAGQPMRIVSNYVPRAQAKRQAANTELCPNCLQQIPSAELAQHMKSKHALSSQIIDLANKTQLSCSILDGKNSDKRWKHATQQPTCPRAMWRTISSA